MFSGTDSESPKTPQYKAMNLAPKVAMNKQRSASNSRSHRRRGTEPVIHYDPESGKLRGRVSTSNMAAITLMQRELPPSAQAAMKSKADQLKMDRELKHLRIKLNEAEEQKSTAVEIIGNLHREREDLMQRNETMATELQAVQTELKILDQKNKSLEQMYRDDTTKYKEEAASANKRMTMIQEQINQKDIELSDAKEYQNRLQHELSSANLAITEDAEEDEQGHHIVDSVKETQLKALLAEEKKKVSQKEAQIDKLLAQLQQAAVVKREKESLAKELFNLESMAKEDVTVQKLQIEKMQREIIGLASRNSKLETEKDDLIAMLEERDYENQMLKTGFGLHREKTARARGSNQFNMEDFNDAVPHDQYDENLDNLETLAFIDNVSAQPSIQGLEDMDSYLERENSYVGSTTSSPTAKGSSHKEVADVTREYLHLTASVVNMKFPRIQHITSEELINKVKNYQFWEYHDMMVNIMRMEEQKQQKEAEAKRREERQQLRAANGQRQQKVESAGVLSRFRNFFGGNNQSKTPKTTSSKKGHPQRHSLVPKSHSLTSQMKNQVNRDRGATYDEAEQHRKQDRAKRGKEVLTTTVKSVAKTGKELKDGAKTKITGIPSDKQSEKMNEMSFQSVPTLGGFKDINESPESMDGFVEVGHNDQESKPKKPSTKL